MELLALSATSFKRKLILSLCVPFLLTPKTAMLVNSKYHNYKIIHLLCFVSILGWTSRFFSLTMKGKKLFTYLKILKDFPFKK